MGDELERYQLKPHQREGFKISNRKNNIKSRDKHTIPDDLKKGDSDGSKAGTEGKG